jgi:hypothetical protein
MTDFVLSAGNTMRPHRSPWGAFPIKHMPISTGLTSNVIFVGSVVGLDQAASTAFLQNVVKIAVSSNTLNPGAGQIVGVAAENPSANLSPNAGGAINSSTPGAMPIIAIWEANPNVEFKAWTRRGVITSSIVGTIKELTRDSTLNIDLVSLNVSSLATPANCVIITGLIDAPGDSGGAVTFRFNTSSGFLAFYR